MNTVDIIGWAIPAFCFGFSLGILFSVKSLRALRKEIEIYFAEYPHR